MTDRIRQAIERLKVPEKVRLGAIRLHWHEVLAVLEAAEQMIERPKLERCKHLAARLHDLADAVLGEET